MSNQCAGEGGSLTPRRDRPSDFLLHFSAFSDAFRPASTSFCSSGRASWGESVDLSLPRFPTPVPPRRPRLAPHGVAAVKADTGKRSARCPGDVNRLYYSPVFLHINASWFSVLRIQQRQPNSRTGRPSHQHAHGDFVTSSGARRQARPALAAKLAEDLDPLRGGEKPDTKGRLPAGQRDRKCAVSKTSLRLQCGLRRTPGRCLGGWRAHWGCGPGRSRFLTPPRARGRRSQVDRLQRPGAGGSCRTCQEPGVLATPGLWPDKRHGRSPGCI